MTPAEEKAWLLGNRAAYRSILGECSRNLQGSTEGKLANALAQLEDVRRSLRTVCEEYGDNDWDDDHHLGDVIDKHLAPYLQEEDEEDPRP